MPKVFVSRSQMIRKPPAEVDALVRRLEMWPRWLPWLVAAPGFEVEFSEEGFSWSGAACGRGRIRVLGAVENEGAEYELVLQKPRKLVAAVALRLHREGDRTEVVLTCTGELPALRFWRKWSWRWALEEEWARGLRMLRDLAEDGVVRSRVEVPGREGCPPFAGVGIRRTTTVEELVERREADQREVRAHYPEGEAITVYPKRNPKKRMVQYVTGVKLERRPGVVADGMELFEFPGSEVFSVRHFGDRSHVGNGWAGGRMHLLARRLKADRKLAPFEREEESEDGAPVVRISLPLR